MTEIEWTDETWNPIRGCSQISPGCDNCYALRIAHRFSGYKLPYHGLTRYQGNGSNQVRWTGQVVFAEKAFQKLAKWRQPRSVFVNSMSDLFHPNLDEATFDLILREMYANSQHCYQILTKRSPRMVELLANHCPSPVWWGVSVECGPYLCRVRDLISSNAMHRFASLEPLLGPVDLRPYLGGLDWVIVGAETGPNKRPCDLDWVRRIRDDCAKHGVRFTVKNSIGEGQILDGVRHAWRPASQGGYSGSLLDTV
jgi:protein gp37